MYLVALCVFGWSVCLFFQVPSFLPGWFFSFEVQPLSLFWMTIWTSVSGGVLWGISKLSEDKQVLVLFLAAWLLPIFLSLAGTQSLIDHCFQSGHAEFVITGSRGWGVYDLIHNYEQIVLSESQRYAASKPPGQVLLYSLFNMLAPQTPGEAPADFVDAAHWGLSLVLTIVMPLLAGLIVFPMFAFSKMMGIDKPWFPVLLYILSAPFSLIVMHMDQALYPMLTMLTLFLFYKGVDERNALKMVIAGAILGVGCFISFSMLPVLLLLGLILPYKIESIPSVVHVVLGFVLLYVFLYFGFGYNPIVRYQNAMIHHAQWKGFPWTWGNWWIATRVNLVEFTFWMGPLMPLFLKQRRRVKDMFIFTMLFLGLLFFGKAAGEVARLWMFLMPVYWIWVCRDTDNCRWEYAVVMMMWTGFMKGLMDF